MIVHIYVCIVESSGYTPRSGLMDQVANAYVASIFPMRKCC